MLEKRTFGCFVLTGAAMLFCAAGVQATELARRPYAELYAGYFSGDSDDYGTGTDIDMEGDMTLGLRFGGHLTDNWAVEGSLGLVPGELSAAGMSVDADYWMLDVSVHYHFNPDSRAVWSLYGGAGAVKVDPDASSLDEESATFHIGAALRLEMGEHFYVRPDLRYRFIIGNEVRHRARTPQYLGRQHRGGLAILIFTERPERFA
jgi:hypothetical protein